MRDPQAEGRRWIDQARYDLKAARWNSEGEYWAVACFWCQQAAEKAVKALLYSKGERVVIGHSVAELLKSAAKHSKQLAELGEKASFLDRFYVPTRYPNGLPGGIPAESFSAADAREALDCAQELIERIESLLA